MIRYCYLDASALVKRYTLETGSVMVHNLLDRLLPLRPTRLLISWLGFLEVVAVLNRHHNDGRLTKQLFQQAMLRLSEEAAQMRFLTISDEIAARALPVMLRHNLNASDALYLQQVLDWQAEHDARTDMIILIAADERLLRAAHAEGVETLSPENDPLDRADNLLAI
ncbi:MAG: type II toxin-antitoxin system VapC family toxin [Anaerolineae bacterium]